MKQLCCFLLFILFSLQGFTQKIKEIQPTVLNGLIDFQFGLSIPVLDFANTDFENRASGYAETGYNIKLGLSYDFSPSLGFCVQYQKIENQFNESDLLADLKVSNKSFQFNSFTSNSWKLQGAMIGLYLPIKDKRLSTDIRFLIGIYTGTLPESTTNYIPPNTTNVYTVKQNESTESNYAYQGGVKIRYQLHENFMFIGSADFTYAEINYKNLTAFVNPFNITIPIDNYTQYYHIINFSAGIGYQFN